MNVKALTEKEKTMKYGEGMAYDARQCLVLVLGSLENALACSEMPVPHSLLWHCVSSLPLTVSAAEIAFQ